MVRPTPVASAPISMAGAASATRPSGLPPTMPQPRAGDAEDRHPRSPAPSRRLPWPSSSALLGPSRLPAPCAGPPCGAWCQPINSGAAGARMSARLWTGELFAGLVSCSGGGGGDAADRRASGPPTLIRLVLDRVPERPHALDLDLDHVAGHQPARRVEAGAGAGRRAGEDEVARAPACRTSRGSRSDAPRTGTPWSPCVSSWRSSPLTRVVSRRRVRSSADRSVTIQGPSAPERSKFLPWVTLNLACRTQSRSVPSLRA